MEIKCGELYHYTGAYRVYWNSSSNKVTLRKFNQKNILEGTVFTLSKLSVDEKQALELASEWLAKYRR